MTGDDRENTNVERALILSGGGARGAYQAGVIKYLNEIGWVPDMVCGTSIGAINAAAYGAGLSADDMAGLWLMYDRKALNRFSLPDFMRGLKGGGKYSPPGDNSRIKAVLEKHIDISALRKSKARILVSALNMKTGQVKFFTNKVIEVKHLMAAAAIPLIFPWQYIDGAPHWDAGLAVNTPVGPALAWNAKEIVVVLHSPLGVFEIEEPQTSKQVLELSIEHILTGSYTALLPNSAWLNTPDADAFETPAFGSARLELSLGGIQLRTVAPPKMLGISSMFNYSEKQAKNLIKEGYTNAKMQLGAFLSN